MNIRKKPINIASNIYGTFSLLLFTILVKKLSNNGKRAEIGKMISSFKKVITELPPVAFTNTELFAFFTIV